MKLLARIGGCCHTSGSPVLCGHEADLGWRLGHGEPGRGRDEAVRPGDVPRRHLAPPLALVPRDGRCGLLAPPAHRLVGRGAGVSLAPLREALRDPREKLMEKLKEEGKTENKPVEVSPPKPAPASEDRKAISDRRISEDKTKRKNKKQSSAK